jgi:hypothetical protein
MPYSQQGGGIQFGTEATQGTPVTFTIYGADGTTALSGYVMPTTNNYSLTHNAEVARSKDGSGDINHVIAHGEYLEASFELVPFGTSMANSLKALTTPALLSSVSIAGAPIIAMGSWANAINVAGGSAPETHKWIYEGGGSVRLTSDAPASLSLTLRRYRKVAGGAIIS